MSKELKEKFENLKKEDLSIDLTRGQPSTEQFNLANNLNQVLGDDKNWFLSEDEQDCRNYPGGVEGLKEARDYFSKILGVSSDNVVVGNNSSLSLMNDVLRWLMLKGSSSVEEPWLGQSPKFICPVPGYDRHFHMLETIGIDLISVPLLADGPDVDKIKEIVEEDDLVKGMIAVPQYSNPTGITFSDDVVIALAKLKPKAKDFTIIWDNAYSIHDLTKDRVRVKNLLACCRDLGCPERAIMFSSTSKITFSGSGIGFMAMSSKNTEYFSKLFQTQYITPDKLNQLRHVKFFKSYDGGLEALMDKHAEILLPKFEAVQAVFEAELSEASYAKWSKPKGGYFINLDVQPGTANRVVELAEELGVKLTNAGATFPGGRDPENKNLRIAPSRPSLDEVKKAAEVVALSIKLAAGEVEE